MPNTSAIENIIKQEIREHKSRRGQSWNGADWENGFIKGLSHCLTVIQKARRQLNADRPPRGSKLED